MKKRKSKIGLLKSSLKFGASRKQTLLVLLGVIVALGASFGVYSQFRSAHASGCPYAYGNYACIGYDNSYGEGMYAWACQVGAYNGRNTVKAHYAVYHSRANGHTYYGGIKNHDATTALTAPAYADSWAWSSGTTVSGFSTLNAQIGVNSNHNNYLGFYASYGSFPKQYGYALIGGTYRPSNLPHC